MLAMKRIAMEFAPLIPILICCLLICQAFIFQSSAAASSPEALLTPITKDPSTNLYTIQAYFKTPLQPTKLFLDLGATLSWISCSNYISSTFQHYLYNTSLCIQLDTGIYGNCFNPPSPSCSNDTCEFFPENSVTRVVAIGDILSDNFALPTTNGRNPGSLGVVSDFVFSCSDSYKPDVVLIKGLPKGITGLAALGRFNFSLPAQTSRAFSSPFIFALCLPSNPSAKGVVILNSAGPYFFLPGIDLSSSLIYTPLILNPFGGTVITYANRPSDEYFINVTSIKVNGNGLFLNQTLLAINPQDGIGGTKITTSTPYTLLQTSIFNAVTAAFRKETATFNYQSIPAIKPFTTCYSDVNVTSTRVGPSFPSIDLVLQSESVIWRIFGANSMVSLKKKSKQVWCLGFIDGGVSPRTSIVIGGHQLEDNLLQFDMVAHRLGFSSSVLFHSTTCTNFNFTQN